MLNQLILTIMSSNKTDLALNAVLVLLMSFVSTFCIAFFILGPLSLEGHLPNIDVVATSGLIAVCATPIITIGYVLYAVNSGINAYIESHIEPLD